MIAKAGADGIELVRNPAFHEWSGAAQPDGFVDAISWLFDQELASAFDQLSAGELDWMTDVPQPEDQADWLPSAPITKTDRPARDGAASLAEPPSPLVVRAAVVPPDDAGAPCHVAGDLVWILLLGLRSGIRRLRNSSLGDLMLCRPRVAESAVY